MAARAPDHDRGRHRPGWVTATVILPDCVPVHAGTGRHRFSGACRDAAEESQ